MPFARPTLSDLIDDAQASFDARIPGADSRLRRSILNVLARVIAGAVNGLYGYLDWIFRQVFADTAEAAELERHASIRGISRIAGAFATGDVTLSGEDGRFIDSGTLLQRADGIGYEMQMSATIAGGTATAPVTATTSGLAGNATAGTSLSFVSPVEGVDAAAIVASPGISGGADRESDEALRARLLEKIRKPPQGGAAHDYVAWAKEVAGVSRVWVLPEYNGEGTVGVTFVRDGESPITPDAVEIQTVADYIEERRPVTAQVTVFAPTLVSINFTIHVEPDTAEVRAAVQAELEDLMLREMAPDGETPLLLSHVHEAISAALGETDHTLTVPAADIPGFAGLLYRVGTITWV